MTLDEFLDQATDEDKRELAREYVANLGDASYAPREREQSPLRAYIPILLADVHNGLLHNDEELAAELQFLLMDSGTPVHWVGPVAFRDWLEHDGWPHLRAHVEYFEPNWAERILDRVNDGIRGQKAGEKDVAHEYANSRGV